jgi:hypothetical protein
MGIKIDAKRLAAVTAGLRDRKKAKDAEPLEKDIQKQILQWLSLKGMLAWRQNTGAVQLDKEGPSRYVRFGVKGCCDILGVLPGGKFLGIEVKRGTGRVSPDQQQFIAMVLAAGGMAFVARSVEDVIEALKGVVE